MRLSFLRSDALSLTSDELEIERVRCLRLFLSGELSGERERDDLRLRLLCESLDADLERGDFKSSRWERRGLRLRLSIDRDPECGGVCV